MMSPDDSRRLAIDVVRSLSQPAQPSTGILIGSGLDATGKANEARRVGLDTRGHQSGLDILHALEPTGQVGFTAAHPEVVDRDEKPGHERLVPPIPVTRSDA